ncbi:class II fructose-bisphosphate aldolase [Sporomusa sp. KB1]|jgi:fructose-bisphosphate aldolase class II|uniref:class II fructose-bisphosphate aldolase n=1 Tax=Sporomusa sp. KB1 TaxID=943346 RepID=UPI0011AA0998|nr:class II fructose-bisphosphate aldolase [Sporomusa sp. KB1]TWH45097.1 fructose-bisphosphate aldolase class II [Sporomusa sp. KB1]
MLANLKDILNEAYVNNYAVGSFNSYNYETFKGIIDAADETKIPVILAFGAKYLKNMSLETAYSIAKSLGEGSETPICLHLDHCNDLATVFRAIRTGFGSVMYDGSALPFEENVKNTKLVCQIAHACGVSVEAELGCLAAGERSHEGSVSDVEVYTEPMAAKQFVDATQVDALAVAIGTVHGMYKTVPNIRLDILENINKLLTIPLVLHGGSGLSEKDILGCIAKGIAKINVNTEISVYAVEKTTAFLANNQPHFSELSLNQVGYVKEIVKKYISFFNRQCLAASDR